MASQLHVDPKFKDLITQNIKVQLTVNAGASGTASISIPQGSTVYLRGYGYSWYTSNTFTLNTGNLRFPSRTDQEGSTSIPVLYDNPFPVRAGGTLDLKITNGDSANHTYDVVFVILTSELIEYNSTGGELILSTGGAGGVVTNAISDVTGSTYADVTAKGLEVDPQSPATLLAGQKTTSGSAAEALASSTACKKVTVQVDSTSPTGITIGNATSQNIQIFVGGSIDIEIDDLAKVYVKRVGASNAIVNYIGS